MNTSNQIVMSAASVAAALQVIGGMHAEQKTLAVPATDSFRTEARAAVGAAQSQAMIRTSMAAIASTVKIDDQTMQDRYAAMPGDAAARAHDFLVRLQAGAGAPYDVGQEEFYKDSTFQPMVLDCYSNCHSACHGSRGWR